jgi:hypothetical protein
MKNLSYFFTISIFILGIYSPEVGAEAQSTTDIITNTEQLVYQPGHGALELFTEDASATTPQWVKHWLNFMLLSFALGLFFVWKRIEARWVVGGMIATMVSAFFIAPRLTYYHLVAFTPLSIYSHGHQDFI